MSDEIKQTPQRYSVKEYGNIMEKSPDGDYVKYSDYEALRRATVSKETAQMLAEALFKIPLRPCVRLTSKDADEDDESMGWSDGFKGGLIRSCRSKAYEAGLDKGKSARQALARFEAEGGGK